MTHGLSVKIEGKDGCPTFDATLSRVNLFLGTNGSGKSKLLDAIAIALRQQESSYKVVQTIGGRAIALRDSFEARTAGPNKIEDLEVGWREQCIRGAVSQPRGNSPQYRLALAIDQLAMILAGEEKEYRNRLYDWGETDRSSKPPDRRESPLQEFLGLFSVVFPDIVISQTDERREEIDKQLSAEVKYSGSLGCKKQGVDYPISKLSDGEKQVFASLVDRYFFKDTKCIFVIDEPELSLDPRLACDYWNLMEREMPDSVFIYATHSLDFAMRENVERVWTLGKSGPVELNEQELAQLPSEEQRRFFGAIRGILAADVGIVVEGGETSFDSIFYPWVLDKPAGHLCVVGYGGCEDVAKATDNLTLWRQIAPGARVVGIIDRDYRNDDELKRLEDTDCLALDLHDAESYLCHPSVLHELAVKLKRPNIPEKSKIEDEIKEFLKETRLKICASRMSQRCSTRRRVSIPKKRMPKVTSDEELVELAQELARDVEDRSPSGTLPDQVKRVLEEEFKKCDEAARSDDIVAALCLVKGKDLLDRLAESLFGLANGRAVVEYAASHLSAGSFPHLRALCDSITAKLVGYGVNS